MRERTQALHRRAERSGFISEILREKGDREGYALFLRNLLPAYEELERGLERHRQSPIFAAVAWADLRRAAALQHDLSGLAGRHWQRTVALLPSANRYARQVAAAATGNGERLLGHAYVRYLGDLSGGQVLKKLLARSFALGPDVLSFFEFPLIADPAAFKLEFRSAIDAAARLVDVQAVVDEAAMAFELNIELSEAILSAARSGSREAEAMLFPR